MKKFKILLAALLCVGALCACGEVEQNEQVGDTGDILKVDADTTELSAVDTPRETQAQDTTIAPTETTADTADISPDISDAYNLEPPLTEAELTMPVPDFLNEEQQLLYRRARSIYTAFSGYPEKIDDYPIGETVPQIREYETIKLPIGDHEMFYYKSQGRYKNWEDFVDMGESIFTVDYFNTLSKLFQNIDGYTYIPDTAKGGRWGYMPELSPDTFQLVSMSDSEIRFEVIGHYYDTWNTDTAEPSTLTTESFPINMVLTENGWRFSLFNSPA